MSDIYSCICLTCGDEWREEEWPSICPECHSRNVAHSLESTEGDTSEGSDESAGLRDG